MDVNNSVLLAERGEENMNIKNVDNKIKSIYLWVVGDDSFLAGICGAFTLVTVVNSYMMVSGTDTPKVGRFAYMHLLLRLTIICIAFSIWDYEEMFAEIKTHTKKLKNLKNLSNIKFKRIYKNVLKNKFNSICITYTATIVFLCIVMISGIYEPRGGAGLYFNLLLLFVFITSIILLLYIFENVKALFKGNQKL